jgi:hypothetical protein
MRLLAQSALRAPAKSYAIVIDYANDSARIERLLKRFDAADTEGLITRRSDVSENDPVSRVGPWTGEPQQDFPDHEEKRAAGTVIPIRDAGSKGIPRTNLRVLPQ